MNRTLRATWVAIFWGLGLLGASMNLACSGPGQDHEAQEASATANVASTEDQPASDSPSVHAGPAAGENSVELFNGRDLTGWKTWLADSGAKDPRDVFSVTQGAIRISGDGFGYLSTEKAYRDYHLIVEYRWGRRQWRGREGKAHDSGIFLHSFGPDGNSIDGDGAFKAALECQVMQGAVGDLLLIQGRDQTGEKLAVSLRTRVGPSLDPDGWPTWDPEGTQAELNQWGRLNWRAKDPRWRDILDFRGPRDVTTPGRGWTRIECICKGDRVEIRVNGVLVNVAEDVNPSSGPILLQCEGSEIFFRSVVLQAPSSTSQPPNQESQDELPTRP